ncbi:MAG: capsular biosynthesis protein [Paenibacillaceae bacterium]|jgi:capsular polysaccharide biosynthesis protein|nr:capsular biosynthesis protein [Paenibacillaceae bacterium]
MEKNLMDYVQSVRRMLWLIIPFVAVSCLTTYYVSKTFNTPVYRAQAQLIINTTNKGQDGITYSDVNMNLSLMESYKEIMRSDKMIETLAASRPELNIDPAEMKKALQVSSPDKTQILNVSVQDESYTRAAQLVNATISQFMTEIPMLMSLNNTTVLKLADPAAAVSPSSSGAAMNLVLSFMVSLMVALGAVFFRENIDRTVRNEKEVVHYSGLPLLASIGVITKQDSRMEIDPIPRKAGETYVAFK